jgi:epoxyqueuosine reductase QueG
MSLLTDLKEMTGDAGAGFFGIADLTPPAVHAAIGLQGGTALARFPRAISVGIALMDAVVNQLPQRSELPISMLYEQVCVDAVNQRLDQLASHLGNALQTAGFQSLPIPASKTVDPQNLSGHFSHKMAARLAGLGWIGKNCLLITPEAGPRLRWVSILTDAPLTAGIPLDGRCGDCQKCTEICPVQAISGRSFDQDEPRQVRFNAPKCDSYRSGVKSATGYPTCGLCLFICPHGKKN